MSNRLTKWDFLIVYAILISISFFIGGFFIGATVAKSKAEEQFSQFLKESNKETSDSLQYSHTDFVTYYYQAFLPFKEYRKQYLSFFENIAQYNTSDQQTRVKELLKLTQQTSKELLDTPFPDSSPLLRESYEGYIRALQSFEKGLQLWSDGDISYSPDLYKQEENFIEGQTHWLRAQSMFYESLVYWEGLYITQETPSTIDEPQQFTLQQWSDLDFHQKNELIARLLEEKAILTYFHPEDAQVYINTYVQQLPGTSPITKVGEVLEFLVASGSIRQGEFLNQRSKFGEIASPTIPLFTN